MSQSSFSNLMSNAININSNTSPEAIQKEKNTARDEVKDYTMDNSEFLYPTLVMIPLIIVLISILTLDIRGFVKFILFLFMIMALVTYVLQIRKYNISKPLMDMSNKFGSSFKPQLRTEQSYIYRN